MEKGETGRNDKGKVKSEIRLEEVDLGEGKRNKRYTEWEGKGGRVWTNTKMLGTL